MEDDKTGHAHPRSQPAHASGSACSNSEKAEALAEILESQL